MGVTVSPQLLLSATASSSHLLSPPACTLCGQHLLQEISKCGVLHWLQCRYLLWCGPPQPARDRSSAVVPRAPPSLLLLWPWCSHHCSTLSFLPSSSAWVLVLPFLEFVTPEAPLSQPQGCVWPCSLILSVCFLLFPFPFSFILLLSHLLSLLPISSLFLSCPPPPSSYNFLSW